MLLSLSINTIWPYRVAQQMLGESIRELAEYLELKAKFYDTDEAVDDIQKELIKQQIDVHQGQENVREVAVQNPQVAEGRSTPESRRTVADLHRRGGPV